MPTPMRLSTPMKLRTRSGVPPNKALELTAYRVVERGGFHALSASPACVGGSGGSSAWAFARFAAPRRTGVICGCLAVVEPGSVPHVRAVP